MTFFKYLFYRLYSWNLKKWGKNDIPHWNALFGVSFMMFLNIGLIGLLLQLFGIKIFLREKLPKIEIVLIMVSIYIINYFLLINKNKYKLIVAEFKNEDLKDRRIKTIVLWLYLILSFGFFTFGAILIGKFKGY